MSSPLGLKSKNSEIADLIPDIIAEVDKNKVYTWLNKAGREFFGPDAEGKEAAYFFEGNQDTYSKVEPIFHNEKDTFYVESWQRRVDGQNRLLAWWCKSLKDESGKVIGALSTARDITENKKNEEKLHEKEAQLYNALKIGHLGPWVYDVKRNMFTFNDLFYEMFRTNVKDIGGYEMTPEEYAKRFLYPEDGPLVGNETKKALETKDPDYNSVINHRILYADGQLGYIMVRIFIVKDENGNTIKTYGVNQDVSEHKKIEEDLKNSKILLESSLESQKDTILFSIDTKYRYLYFNIAHKNAMKYAYNKEIKEGMNILECITSDEDRIAAKENYDRALAGESHTNIREFGVDNKAYYESFFNPIKNENNIIGATGLARNITDRINTEETIKAKVVELEKMNKIMIDREIRMAELKDTIKELESQNQKT